MEDGIGKEPEKKKVNDDLVMFMRKRSENEAPRYTARLKNYVDIQRKKAYNFVRDEIVRRRRAAIARRASEGGGSDKNLKKEIKKDSTGEKEENNSTGWFGRRPDTETKDRSGRTNSKASQSDDDNFEGIVISLQVTVMSARRKHKSSNRRGSADTSVENLLYYKDCKLQHSTTPPKEPLLRVPELPKPPACPCPRMCCSMRCDCGVPEGGQSFVSRHMMPLQMPSFNVPPQISMPEPPDQQPMQYGTSDLQARPPLDKTQIQRRGVKEEKMMMMFKKPRKPGKVPPPPTRRLGFTRENVKSLISKDQDVKKILNDLVRATMSKVDLIEAVKTRRHMMTSTPKLEETPPSLQTDDDDYMYT